MVVATSVMAQQLLYGPNVRAPLQQVRREAMTESVRAHHFDQSRLSGRNLDPFIHHRWVHMMPPHNPGQWVR